MTQNWKLIIPAVFIAIFFIQCKEKFPHGDPDNGGLFLPKGFEAEVVADSLQGAARHLTINSNGDIYVKLRLRKGVDGVIAALRDKDNDGKADRIRYFGIILINQVLVPVSGYTMAIYILVPLLLCTGKN